MVGALLGCPDVWIWIWSLEGSMVPITSLKVREMRIRLFISVYSGLGSHYIYNQYSEVMNSPGYG